MAMRLYFDPSALSASKDLVERTRGLDEHMQDRKIRMEQGNIFVFEWPQLTLHGLRLAYDEQVGLPYVELKHFQIGLPAAVSLAATQDSFKYVTITHTWRGDRKYCRLVGYKDNDQYHLQAIVDPTGQTQTQLEMLTNAPPIDALNIFEGEPKDTNNLFAKVRLIKGNIEIRNS